MGPWQNFQDASDKSLLCFSFSLKSKTNNSPITADTVRLNSLLLKVWRALEGKFYFTYKT